MPVDESHGVSDKQLAMHSRDESQLKLCGTTQCGTHACHDWQPTTRSMPTIGTPRAVTGNLKVTTP